MRAAITLLWDWAGRDRGWIIAAIALSCVSGLCTMVPYWGLYRVMDALLLGTASREVLLGTALLIAAGILARFTLFGISGICSHKGAYRTLFRVRKRVVEHLSRVPLGQLSERSTGAIKTVLTEDIEKLELFLAHHLPEFFYYLIGPVAVFGFLLAVNPPLALLSLVPLLGAMLVMGWMFRRASGLMPRASSSLVGLNSVMVEYIGGMRVIKALGMGSRSFGRFREAVDAEQEVWSEMSRRMGPLYAAYIVIIESGLLLVVPAGGLLFAHGSLSASAFLLFAFVGSLYLTEIRPLQELASNFALVCTGAMNAEQLLTIPVFTGSRPFPERHDIELDGVGFSYDGERDVLRDLDLTIAQGERIALVGDSGAGKSTIVGLISRFHDVTAGSVRIGGVDVRELDYEQLLAHVSIVFQKTFLTSGSIGENIRLGTEATPAEVRAAAREAQIDDVVIGLPDGYDTPVGNLGGRLSGGERQRIAIARAILKDAPILILDEATSAADPENQEQIDAAIERLCRGRTTIIVAHRLGIATSCDRVAVVEDGRVSCVGPHEEVLRRNSGYRRSWETYARARTLSYAVGRPAAPERSA